ncbi:MAG: peptidylprolyl isomerase [Oscillospiraceae bacterium]
MKKFFAAAAAVLMLALTGCTVTSSNYNAMQDYDFTQLELVQLEPPKDGDTIAIFDTSYGEIRVKLYEEYAPNTVNAFVERAKSGYYDGQVIYGVMSDVYFLTGGNETENGYYKGRESDAELVANEYSVNMWPFKGALLSYSEKVGYSDARYFIVNTDAESLTEDAIGQLKESADKREDETERKNLNMLFDKFYEVGGVFGLSGTCTVFGQTYEGFDVIEKLCAIPTSNTNRPDKDVFINSVTISVYKSE